MKTQNLLLILGAIALAAIAIVISQKKKTDAAKVNQPEDSVENTMKFILPTNSDPSVFGPVYWKAYQDLTASIPCSGCKGFAEKFISFFHDLVNLKLGRPLHDSENFAEMSQLITTINLKGNRWPEE